MKQKFKGWRAVARRLKAYAVRQQQLAIAQDESATRLNAGQRASLHAISERITKNGIVIADEVGMGKTRIAVALARSVIESGGRVAILVPPGLGYQWQAELRDGGIVDAPPILRSLWAYLAVWESNTAAQQKPWFEKQVVVVSHAFTNWRLGEHTDPWRWALLPALYARWRKRIDNRFPRAYHDNEDLSDAWVRNAAESIIAAIPSDGNQASRRLDQLLQEIHWPDLFDITAYARSGQLRVWLECSVGLGLGIFDLVIVDEAHKSRGTESGLSRMLDNVILPSEEARRLAMTATPVELDVSQWPHTLSRIGLDEKSLVPARQAIEQYASAVTRVRQSWRSSQEARDAYKCAAADFQETLSPYLLRRNKRDDPAVQLFRAHSGLPINDYRQETEIAVETASLSPAWRQAVCAAEALSVVTRQVDDPIAKRLRLTMGNGHGIAALLDQIKRDDAQDLQQEEYERPQCDSKPGEVADTNGDLKRQARAQWWLDAIQRAFTAGDHPLFEHPAILAAVTAIEDATRQGEKVLVFGRFASPLRALVDILNAREMLRCLLNNHPWPQAKVHGEQDDDTDNSEWRAVRAAHHQLQCALPLDAIDDLLRTRYDTQRLQRARLREQLIVKIERGLKEINPGRQVNAIMAAFKISAQGRASGASEVRHPLALVSRAITELLGDASGEFTPSDYAYAQAFIQLIEAVSDRDDGDTNRDSQPDETEASKLWQVLEERLHEEYNRPQGGFARLMFGGTQPESRRMIQLAFNRPNSFPRVLVAQSMVGREGLNLHQACRIVVMLHPEWNPGVVEQQIGRVDRVDSHWSKALKEAIAKDPKCDLLPRIEVRPVIFRGTYDEYHWQVLHGRWDDLRAQLHGIVIPPRLTSVDPESQRLVDEISKAAPNFSHSIAFSELVASFR